MSNTAHEAFLSNNGKAGHCCIGVFLEEDLKDWSWLLTMH